MQRRTRRFRTARLLHARRTQGEETQRGGKSLFERELRQMLQHGVDELPQEKRFGLPLRGGVG